MFWWSLLYVFLSKDDKFLETYNNILYIVSNLIKNGFDKEPLYNKIYLKTKIKSCDDKVNTNFHDNEIPKEGRHCVCLLVIWTDFAFKTSSNCYSQIFLKECKYVANENKVSKFINKEIKLEVKFEIYFDSSNYSDISDVHENKK